MFKPANAPQTFEALGIGTGANSGKVAKWETDGEGVLVDEDINELDDSDKWISIAEATAQGYEEQFGKDLDLDGLVSSSSVGQDTAAVVLKNSSDSFENVTLTDANGRRFSVWN